MTGVAAGQCRLWFGRGFRCGGGFVGAGEFGGGAEVEEDGASSDDEGQDEEGTEQSEARAHDVRLGGGRLVGRAENAQDAGLRGAMRCRW